MIKGFKKITPEEKLLHIIEKPEEAEKLDINRNTKPSPFAKLKLGKSLERFKNIDIKKINLRGINKILLWISVVITIAVIVYFVRDEKRLGRNFENIKIKAAEREDFKIDGGKTDIPNLSAYLDETQKNNPFHTLPFIQKLKSEEVEKKINLQLVGIFWSDNPQAIIEDTATGRNYMVYEGDQVDKYKVGKITQREVRLTSEDGNEILR